MTKSNDELKACPSSTTDGDAERVLAKLKYETNRTTGNISTGYYEILSKNDVDLIVSALQSTRRSFKTEDASDEDIASVEAATYGQSTRKPDDNGERLARECHGSIFQGRMQTWVHKIVCSKAIVEWEPKYQPSLEHEITAIAQSAFDTAKNLLKAATRKPDAVTPTDGDAERVLAKLKYETNRTTGNISTGYYEILSKDDVDIIVAALQSTRKPPVGTIAVPREVFLRAMEAMEYVHFMLRVDQQELRDKINKTLASLDAVFSEGE